MSSALADLSSNIPQQSSSAATGYFVDQKKGEVNELKQLLKNLNIEKDVRRKREIIKKVIAYMTLGIDVSRLFTDMIMAIETKDIVMKKMIYFYLSNYAHSEPEMAIMCINSLRRDCDNEDPLVRGLALRSLCSLRLESILEYVEQPLQKAFNDISSYVRKTAVMAVLKIHYLSPSLVESNGYVATIQRMLQDTDANVVTNAIYVLNELQLAQGGIEVNQASIFMLLNRIGEFSEWGLNVVLDLVCRYKPANEDEVYAVMNLLDPVLRTANSGSVLATIKCFLQLSSNMPEMHPQIIARAKPPLLTLITGGHPEAQYMTLKHLRNILHQPVAKNIFDDEYRQFFVRYNEPPHVKHLKVELLPMIANSANARDIATELNEYVTDVDSELSKRAIRALGEIASTIEAVAEEMTTSIVQLLDIESSYIRAEAAIVLCDIIRIHPRLSDLTLPSVGKHLKRIDDVDAKAALIWMLGEFGGNVLEAPYIVEQIVEHYDDETAASIKLQVLTAAMKLFFQRPPEMQHILGKLLKQAINDTTNQDLHDRALLYHRLLASDVTAASTVFAPGVACNIIDQDYAEKKDLDMKKKLFAEFNTLAVIFDMPSSQFVDDKYQLKLENVATSDYDFSVQNAHAGIVHGTVEIASSSSGAVSAPPAAATGSVNLLDWEDSAAPVPHAAPAAPSTGFQLQDFRPDLMTPQQFQGKWMEYPDIFNGKMFNVAAFPNTASDVEAQLRQQKIFAIASGALPGPSGAPIGYKVFAYGVETGDLLSGGDGAVFLAQILVLQASKEVVVTLKHDPRYNMKTKLFLDLIHTAMLPFQPFV